MKTCFCYSKTCLYLFACLSAGSLHSAEDPSGPAGTALHDDIHELDPFVVSASLAPRSSRDMLTPATVVAGAELARDRAATIGATLAGQPGVHATAFGAGASRPVIRGLEGVRLRVMESGVEAGDLSAESPDHAVAVEPFFVERIEILRGASTLLYGSSAIGGVVNAIDRRLPREPLAGPATVDALADYQSAAEGWTLGALVAVPVGDWVAALSYLDRDHGDYTIPGAASLEDEDLHEEHDHGDHETGEEQAGVLGNSFVETQAGSAALAWFPSEHTRMSLGWLRTDSRYGVPGHAHGAHEEAELHAKEEHEHAGEEEGVHISMTQTTSDLELEHQITGSWLQSIEGRVRMVQYAHQEIEDGTVGTRFDRDSVELRLLTTHLVVDDAPGAFGIQAHFLDAKSVGEESLTPESETRDAAVFVLQECNYGPLRFEGGLRAEHRDIDTVGAGSYDGWALSGSAGAKWNISANWSAGLLFNHARRHPTVTELFASGAHAATRQFEEGDPGLGLETASGFDLSLHLQTTRFSGSLTAFHTDFSDFIFAAPTGEEEDGLPVFQFTQVDAVFRGIEAEAIWHAWHGAEAYFDVGLLGDLVKTDIRRSGDQLPRIPPARAGLRLLYGTGPWRLSSTLRRTFKQDQTARFETATSGYTELSAALSVVLPFNSADWRLLVTGENLLDEEIRPHTSPIKDVAPAPGRHLRINLTVAF